MTTTSITPPATPTRYRFSVDEYYAMADAGILTRDDRVELLDGDIINMPPIGDWHQAEIDQLNHLLQRLLDERPLCASRAQHASAT